MKTFRVYVEQVLSGYTDIAVETVEEAREIAEEEIDSLYIFPQGDEEYRIVGIEEIDESESEI